MMTDNDRENRRTLSNSAALGRHLRDLRVKAGLTQSMLARHIGYKNASMIGGIESGSRAIPVADIPTYAQCLSVRCGELTKLILQCRKPDLYHALFTVDEVNDARAQAQAQAQAAG
ncbi:helix-turn-helix domain-containing protein [Sulfitobacter sp. M22]|uniref:helix-turn-helix domain-containing protein n=1 Tax=Sulfitobacter sp. M22 TaxID=2675332 RepID=UPI001F33CEE8|nr:helix-turn-helix transcriptional regulator [Sulfitobacter sp. M22]MCF7728690.1 helix-turn-helix domain-containing protein [Sulfitobacter sp. M22]